MSVVLWLHPDADVDRVRAELRRRGAEPLPVGDAAGHALLVSESADTDGVPGVARVLRPSSPHPRVDAAPAVVRVGDVELGAGSTVLMAGPCAVEDADGLETVARTVSAHGARVLRGGAFKPRTSPYAFRGAGREALRWLRAAADRHGLAVVTEALEIGHLDVVAAHADLVQIGSRNMQNYPLLEAAGRSGLPVLLKRAAAATVEEWLLAAEYVLAAGAPGVALCERGIRALPQPTRYTLDLGAVAWLLEHAGLPVVVDPSHAAGERRLVPRLARAAWALGAHGVMVEVHSDPGRARSDGAQALDPRDFAALAKSLPVERVLQTG